MKWRQITGLLIFILVCLAGWYFGFVQKRAAKSDQGILVLYGNVDIRQVDLGFQVAGRIQSLHYEEGDRVKANSLLAQLDTGLFKEAFQQNVAQLGVQEANLAKLLVGTRQEQIAQLRATVKEREAILHNASALLAKRKAVVALGGVTRQDYENALSDRDAALARLEEAQQALREGINGPIKEEIQAARANVKAAKASLSQTHTQLSYTKLFSPSTGIIQSRVVEPGTVVAAGQTVYTLALASPKWVWTYLQEADLGRVKSNIKAEVYTDAKPNQPYMAQVGYIAPTAEFTPKNIETQKLRTALVYPMRLVVHDPYNILRQGMPVTVRLYTDIPRLMKGNGND